MDLNHITTKADLHLNYKLALILFLGLFATLAFGIWAGYSLSAWRLTQKLGPLVGQCQHYLQEDRDAFRDLELQTEQYLQVLTQYLGRIEANLLRINALGQKLVEHAQLDPQEFNFHHDSGIGSVSSHENSKDAISTIRALDAELSMRYTQLNALHQSLQSQLSQHELSLSGKGKSVAKGSVSSFFGSRPDPFTGRKAWHAGVDIMGKEGGEVKALAGGVVNFADEKGGYGRLIEINHGNGLATRYGHNKELLVHPGQLVKKGQTIALLGSSGHSTGPHVHVEVHKNGEAVDPGHYFSDLKKN